MDVIEAKAVPQGLGARHHLTIEVVGAETAGGLKEVQQHPRPQRSVAHNEPAGGGLGQQCAIDQKRRDERFGFNDGQPESVNEAFFVQLRDLLAEGKECLARYLPDAFSVPILVDLGGCESHVTTDRYHLRHAAQWYLQPNLLDDGRD
jgi:hypothetical protein